MRIPTIRGVIDRRILANYRIESDVMARALPAPFRPQTVQGYAIGGICLIRLKHLRPTWLPLHWGLRSENAAHRIAVEWDADGNVRTGVFIPRRDTDSRLSTWAGGRIFPGVHEHASFTVAETAEHVAVALTSDDGATHVAVSGRVTEDWPDASIFPTLREASAFFESGSLGYSSTARPGEFDGLELRCDKWRVDALATDHIASSYFQDTARFPAGSVTFDFALLMRGIDHEWHGHAPLCCSTTAPC